MGRGGQGIALGLASTLFWAFYNVGTSIGRADGFSSADLAMLRYGVAAICLLPLLIVRRGVASGIGLWRLCLLTALIGPSFALFINAGYGIAPLAHAVVISPGVTMLVANMLSVVVDRRPMPGNRIAGMALLVVGLGVIAYDQPDTQAATSSLPVWVGDLCFVASGTLWGVFTWLVGRWQLPALETTAAVSAASAIVFLPIYLLGFGVTATIPVGLWIEQAVYQGILGGVLAIAAFAACILRLGTGTAALFPALLPPAAILIAIPLTGSLPTALELAGIAFATTGLVVALDVTRRLAARRDDGQARKTDGV